MHINQSLFEVAQWTTQDPTGYYKYFTESKLSAYYENFKHFTNILE